MILCRILLIFVLLFSNIGSIEMNDNNILEIMTTANEIIIYNNNQEVSFEPDSQEFNKIVEELSNLSQSSREAPAFGVSLHNETIAAMEEGLWIEANFNKTISHNDMPFDSLLIQVVGEYSGFNIIRKYDNKYEGRCFYVDLIDTNLSSLENILLSLI